MEIKIGTTYTATETVTKDNIASAVGSGLVEVYATPMMIALMERAASECIQPFLEDGQVSVGTHINVSHAEATPMGIQVSATATVRESDRRRIEFDVIMADEAKEIGKGTHTRFIVDKKRFMEKVTARR